MTNKKPNIDMIIELIGAVGIHNLSDQQVHEFKTDPHSFLADFNLDPKGDIDLTVIENTETEMHLTLPFYSELEKSSVSTLSDENIEDISGGEIVITFAVIGIGVAAGGLYALSENVKAKARDVTYEVITGEGDPHAK